MRHILLACLLAIAPVAGQNSTRAEVELQKAIQKETVDGDLRGAMDVYRRLAARTAEPAVAASKPLADASSFALTASGIRSIGRRI